MLYVRRPDRGVTLVDGQPEHSRPSARRTEPVAADSDTRSDLGWLGEPPTTDLEHQRIVSAMRRRLFGDAEPVTLGRYVLERRLGVGGMGEVFLARDEALDRRVAVKRVRTRIRRGHEQERLRREAKALARLSHPNVVQIYEVGEQEGQTFLAMEYVRGQTLGEWMSSAPRPWRRVLEVFLAAGRGLAAAHEAGLVHRDFKPDNVLLGDDGSVRVADFGLVLADEDRRLPADAAGDPAAVRDRLSQAGAIVGTIRYMSLEQLCGQPVDARADQFSFCLSLYEALWGDTPFPLTSALTRLSALRSAPPRPPGSPSGARPPGGLWRVIRRGLHRDPGARWPSMAALLAALEAVLRRRRRLAWAGITAAAALAGLGTLATAYVPAAPCDGLERELWGTWDEPQRGVLEATLAGLSASHVPQSQQRVEDGLDRWSAEWVEVRTRTCRAHAELSAEPEVARLRRACLTRQRHRVGALVELLGQSSTNADALAGAVDAVAELPRATECEDDAALTTIASPPSALADQVEALRHDIDRSHQLRLLGHLDQSLALAQQTDRAAQGLDYAPLHAEALAEHARSELAAGSLDQALARMQEAVDRAELTHHDPLTAALWLELSLRTLVDLRDPQRGEWQLHRAHIANERVNATARARARLAFGHGQLALLRGDEASAEGHLRAALVELEDDPSTTDRPTILEALATTAEIRDPSGTEALELYEAALHEASARFGSSHPHTAQYAYRLGVALSSRDEPRARELLHRAANVWMASHGHPHQDLAKAHLLLAKLALRSGESDTAWSHAQQLSSLLEHDAATPLAQRGNLAQLLSVLHSIRGEHEASLNQARRALSVWERDTNPDPAAISRINSIIVSALLALGRLDEASVTLDRLSRNEGTAYATEMRLQQCELAIRRGHLDVASATLEAIEADGIEALGAHAYSYALLRALVEVRRDTLEPASLQRLRSAQQTSAFSPVQIDRWAEQLGLSPGERTTLLGPAPPPR